MTNAASPARKAEKDGQLFSLQRPRQTSMYHTELIYSQLNRRVLLGVAKINTAYLKAKGQRESWLSARTAGDEQYPRELCSASCCRWPCFKPYWNSSRIANNRSVRKCKRNSSRTWKYGAYVTMSVGVCSTTTSPLLVLRVHLQMLLELRKTYNTVETTRDIAVVWGTFS